MQQPSDLLGFGSAQPNSSAQIHDLVDPFLEPASNDVDPFAVDTAQSGTVPPFSADKPALFGVDPFASDLDSGRH
jgi:hypothetical protein